MLMNFCDRSLLSQAKCDTISTDGYEVINLTTGNNKGFLAYSTIKPPVHIDFTFVCKIQISHILIWPSTGAQKSSGFRLSINSSNDKNTGFDEISTGYLKSTDTGLYLYRKDLDYSEIPQPINFLQKYIQLSKNKAINGTDSLRLSIIKTDNSIPTIIKIEIWGRISLGCDKVTRTTVETLWKKRHIKKRKTTDLKVITTKTDNDKNKSYYTEIQSKSLAVPEDFLDPITCDIMMRPVVLPSGKIIDQSTLEKHENSEAKWGRISSDLFTGIPFNANRKPVVATALKARIDKYLLENGDFAEIKKIPRVLGSIQGSSGTPSSIICEISQNSTSIEHITKKRKCNSLLQSTHKHLVPASQATTNGNHIKLCKETENKLKIESMSKHNRSGTSVSNMSIERDLELSIQKVLSSCKRFNMPDSDKPNEIIEYCTCCTNKILYRLPCKHIVCRKKLNYKNKCHHCGAFYSTKDPIRIFI